MVLRAVVVLSVVLGASLAPAGDVELPVGSAPEPLAFPHFPSRLHAVVWRNWQLVEPARLAEVLGATEEQIVALAMSMGLPPAGHVPPDLVRRAYITILRRNWHLLPYEQLLKLVDKTAEQLAFALREDDFLFIKLGSLKPRCGPVTYAEPDRTARERAAQIKQIVQDHFGAELQRPGEPRFAFVDRLSRVPRDFHPPPRRDTEGPRFLSSYFGAFGDPLSDGMAESYPEGLLAAWPARASTASGSMSCSVSLLPADRTSRNSAKAGRPGWLAFAAWWRGPTGTASMCTST